MSKELLHGIASHKAKDKGHGAKVKETCGKGLSDPKAPYVGIWQL